MHKAAVRGAALIAGILTLIDCRLPDPPPRYDHVVVVVEENHDAQQVMGSPYFASLADRGVSFASFFGITHPSQPNYIGLFSGDTHGVTDDGHHDLSGPNLALALENAGLSFAGYSESLPSAGYRGDTAGPYRRKHNPWASFTNVPDTVNHPFTDFPADFSQLPTVSIVVPNQDNDMHDGTIAAADAWLRTNLDAYARWAVSHNSLFIVTFDECAGGKPVSTTPIATVIVGAHVPPRTVLTARVTLYSLLRMLLEMYDLDLLGEAESANRIAIWN